VKVAPGLIASNSILRNSLTINDETLKSAPFHPAPFSASFRVGAGAPICLAGCFLVTAGINVPLNLRLDEVNPTDAGAAGEWRNYVARWQPWNHICTIATFLSAACYAIGALIMLSA
jgi:hypothetical protein